MGTDPAVIAASAAAARRNGAGAGGTRNIAGSSPLHVALEEELADLHGKDAALLFTSGYVSNQASLGAILNALPDWHVFSDAQNHNSMIVGIRDARRATVHVFAHNDLADLRRRLAAAPAEAPKLIVFESVYSMDGDIAPIGAICDLADEFNALTYLDEVHAVGIYGAHGGGVAERDGVAGRVTIIEGTLAKAFGCHGGYITGDFKVLDYIRSVAAGVHLHHGVAAADRGRGADRDPHVESGAGAPGAAVQPGGNAEGEVRHRRPADDAEPEPHRAADDRRRQSGDGC